MKTLALGDYDTLVGTPLKPSKVLWLRDNGIKVDGVQIISLPADLLPLSLTVYDRKIMDLLEDIPDLERVSVALLCWPKIKTVIEGQTLDVAASTFLSEDLYFYAISICQALQRVHDRTGIQVDISYHPMLTWPTIAIKKMSEYQRRHLQTILWYNDKNSRERFSEILNLFGVTDVGINVENEPTTSDQWANLTHTGNRLFSEQVYGLHPTWNITADLQHCAMMLECLKHAEKYTLAFPPYGNSQDPALWTWEAQFDCLRSTFLGDITFHVAQMDDPMRHVTPPIRFDDLIMDWPQILRLMKELDEYRNGQVWYAVEIDGGHLFPEGYEEDLKALWYLQDYFRK